MRKLVNATIKIVYNLCYDTLMHLLYDTIFNYKTHLAVPPLDFQLI